MPNYDYECTKCGDEFEQFQQMTHKPLTKCKKCGGRLRRLIGAGAGIIFKGTGFYATDYKKSSPKEEKKSAVSTKEEKKPAASPKEEKKPVAAVRKEKKDSDFTQKS